MPKIDFLIAGGGIMGITFALMALQAGYRVKLLDVPRLSSTSRISSGLINPLSGKRFTPLWNSDIVFPTALQWYRMAEKLLNQRLLTPLQATRLFLNNEERTYWLERRSESFPQIRYFSDKTDCSPFIQRYGGIILPDVFRLNTALYLEQSILHLQTHESYQQVFFDIRQCTITNETIRYNDIKTRTLVLCEGWKALENPLTSWLPLVPAKGELLTLQTPTPIPDGVTFHKVFIFTEPDGTLRVGSTYTWEDLDETPTELGKSFLLERLQLVLPVEYSILRHDAAVRPASSDNLPFWGFHPSFPRCLILNGLGAKGVVFAPYVARTALQEPANTHSKPQEILSLQRFNSKFNKHD